MRIDEQVREAHLSHFCPGGAGFTGTTPSGPVGFGPAQSRPREPAATGAAGAAGQRCGRCGTPIGPGQDARRRASGGWVHETCPP
jgi:hypothetical protein